MKKPVLLYILSIMITLIGLVMALYTARLILIYFRENEIVRENFRAYIMAVATMVFTSAGMLSSGILLFLGKEIGRKIYLITIVLSLVLRVYFNGVGEIQAFGIPVMILVFLYQYWGIKSYFIEKRAGNIN